jgi:predicted nucleic acid-binding protein
VRYLFADTSFYQALLNARDRYHELARELPRDTSTVVVTTEYIVMELGALMSRGTARDTYVNFVRTARESKTTILVPASSELFEKGFALFTSRPDKDWSMTDCVSFVVMNQFGINAALASDRHFEQAGFQLLLQ